MCPLGIDHATDNCIVSFHVQIYSEMYIVTMSAGHFFCPWMLLSYESDPFWLVNILYDFLHNSSTIISFLPSDLPDDTRPSTQSILSTFENIICEMLVILTPPTPNPNPHPHPHYLPYTHTATQPKPTLNSSPPPHYTPTPPWLPLTNWWKLHD